MLAMSADLAIEPALTQNQNDLFDSATTYVSRAERSETPGSVLRMAPSQVQALEHAIDALNAKLHPLHSLVLPAETAAPLASSARNLPASGADHGRARRDRGRGGRRGSARYVNGLSDYLFVAARAANDFGRSDVLWAPGANQSESQNQTQDDE